MMTPGPAPPLPAGEHDTHLYYKDAISQNALSGHPEAQPGRLRALLASE
jgi:hypothetical protein